MNENESAEIKRAKKENEKIKKGGKRYGKMKFTHLLLAADILHLAEVPLTLPRKVLSFPRGVPLFPSSCSTSLFSILLIQESVSRAKNTLISSIRACGKVVSMFSIFIFIFILIGC